MHKLDVARMNTSVMVQIKPNDEEMKLELFFSKYYPGPRYKEQNKMLTKVTSTGKFTWTIPSSLLNMYTGKYGLCCGVLQYIITDVPPLFIY